MGEDLREKVRERYAEAALGVREGAEGDGSCCGEGAACCGASGSAALEVDMARGVYSEAEKAELPRLAAEASAAKVQTHAANHFPVMDRSPRNAGGRVPSTFRKRASARMVNGRLSGPWSPQPQGWRAAAARIQGIQAPARCLMASAVKQMAGQAQRSGKAIS